MTTELAGRLLARAIVAESQCRFGDAEDMREAAHILESKSPGKDSETVVKHALEIMRLRSVLEECAKPWASRPGLMLACHNEMGEEFQRRLNLAAEALSSGQPTSPVNGDEVARLANLETTPAQRARIRELAQSPNMDDYDRSVLELLDDFAKCVALIAILGDHASRTSITSGQPPKCKRCNDTGWLEPIGPKEDGSYITSRPCSCNR